MDEIIPKGTYRARAVSARGGKANTGGDQVGIRFKFEDGQPAVEGKTITGYFSFSDAAFDYTIEKMSNAGWIGPDPTDYSGIGDAIVELVIDHDTDQQGVLRAKVGFVNRADAGIAMKGAYSKEEAAVFAAKNKGRAAAVLAKLQASGKRSPNAKPAAGAEAARSHLHDDAPPIDDDDLQF